MVSSLKCIQYYDYFVKLTYKMATTSQRITRSRAIKEAAFIGNENDREKTSFKIEPNDLDGKQERKRNGKASKADSADQGKCFPDIVKIKDEPVANNHGHIEEISSPVPILGSSIVKKEPENEVASPYFLTEELSASEIKTESKLIMKRKHVTVAYEVLKVDSNDEKTLGSSPYFDSGDGTTTQTSKGDEFDGKKTKWEPPNWAEVVDNIREMRKERNAPVDGMGCDVWMDEDEAPEVSRFQSLVSLMLSSQTKDEATHAAMTRLRAHGLTIDRVLDTDEETLGKLIYPISFWKTKARHLRRAARDLQERFRGDVPDTVAGLQSLPGVGPKMAHLCMNVAWGKTTGIGVDTHVHRIANRLGWVRTDQPEQTRRALEAWLPQPLWTELNHLLVGFGQQTCRARTPRCSDCLNAKRGLCPAANATAKPGAKPRAKAGAKAGAKAKAKVAAAIVETERRMGDQQAIEPCADVFDASATKRTHVQVEVESNEKNVNKSTRSNSQAPESGEVSLDTTLKWEPPNWTEVLENLRAEHVREVRGRPPCNFCIDGFVSPVVLRYQALVSQMLKKSTEDTSVDSAMQRLRKHGLTVPNMARTEEKIISKLIYPLVGWKTKAHVVSSTTQLLAEQHGGDLPLTLEQLMKLPGVEPKTALVCLTFARDPPELSPEGLVVLRRVGWLRDPSGTLPRAEAQAQLLSWLPAALAEEVLHVLNAFGRTPCRSTAPACATCVNRTLCPWFKEKQARAEQRPKIEDVLAEFGL